jgi:cytochrome c oxidase subunit 3
LNTSVHIDASQYPDYSYGLQAPVWWGMVGLVAVEATVFATLIVSFFYLKTGHVAWPPDGTSPPELLLPTIATVLLLASVLPVYYSDKAIKRDDAGPLKVWPLASIALALAFLAIKAYEYSHIGFWWDTHAYGSVVWTMIGLHTAHVLAVILKTLVIVYLARRDYFHHQRRIGVTVNGLYWYFVALVWLPLYATIYLGSRIWTA